MKSNIALIGFMGTGKSAVGRRLAQKTGKDFFELDEIIEQNAGRSIAEIFRRDGEIIFRAMEIEATKEVAAKKNAVIACGGGIVLNQINIDRLKEESVIVCLTATTDAILKRTSRLPDKRPLLQSQNKPSQISSLLSYRKPFYARAADITVETSYLTMEQVTAKIIAELEEYEDYAG